MHQRHHYCVMQWRLALAICLGVAMIPEILASSCTTDADCRYCGGYCENPALVCMCPPSYCASIGGNCSFNGRNEGHRCQCQGGEFCGYWSSVSGCVSAASRPRVRLMSTTSAPSSPTSAPAPLPPPPVLVITQATPQAYHVDTLPCSQGCQALHAF